MARAPHHRDEINDPYDREVHRNLVIQRNALFFPEAPAEFRVAFRSRWSSWLHTKGLRIRTLRSQRGGTEGSYFWVEDK